MGVPDLFGSPEAVARWEKVHDVLVNRHRLSPKPGLIGLSRGALYCMAWAAAHPDKALAVYLDNGVCDFKSWPGGNPKGLGTGVGSGFASRPTRVRMAGWRTNVQRRRAEARN